MKTIHVKLKRGRVSAPYTRPRLSSTQSVFVTETMQPLNISHKKCSRQAETWTSVSPWSQARLAAVAQTAADMREDTRPTGLPTPPITVGGLLGVSRTNGKAAQVDKVEPKLPLLGFASEALT
jgi:hypothetical protein